MKLLTLYILAAIACAVSATLCFEHHHLRLQGSMFVFASAVFVANSLFRASILRINARIEEIGKHIGTLETWHKERVSNRVVLMGTDRRDG